MKKLVTLIFIIIINITTSLNGVDNISRKIKENPILAHFLSLEEILLNEDYERDFTPTDPPTGVVRQTSEFEKMEGVLVVYPLGVPYALIAEMSQDIIVYTIVQSYQQNQCETNYQNSGVNMANCEFINAATNTYWVRDFGPWFVSVDNEIAIVDFPYNRPRPLDDEIPVIVANYFGIDLYGMDIEHTGGNYMCDGNFIGASTDLVYDENPGLTPAEIDQLVLDYLGIENYHVTMDPLDEYIKHIDCWGKFLDVDKVMIGQVPQSDYRYADFEFVADYFAGQTSAWGNNYEVYRVYTPGGYSQPTPYTNSLILNSKVFVPITGSQWDDEAIASYEEAMPGYEIFGIYSSGWADTDALHCRTRGVADRNMLYIQHDPILDEMPAGEEVDIVAQIVPYSGDPLYADSLLVKYRINYGEFNSLVMTPTGNDNYIASIPALDPGCEIFYYIHAADESGHSSNHPIMGEPDPHTFIVAGNPYPAELVVYPVSFSIEMAANEVLVEIMQMTNIGGLSMDYDITESADWLSIDPVSGTLLAGASTNIEFTFDTTDMTVGDYSVDVIIIDDREETIVPISLTITGTNTHNDIVGAETKLLGNYPNPFNPETAIKYNLKNNSEVTIKIYNTKGQLVRTLVNSSQEAGIHSTVWNGKDTNGRDVSSGIYFSTFDANDKESDYTSVKKIILLK
ncbi:MAG: agmatine deiminase family protein [Candidatus Cloacimonadota bacterium]|nr:agmatine deiminase family protein [Candidatus Cloacimonadota bacterium]